eukprot:3177395-Pyramimonas_sp.AAC.3
MAIGPFSFAMRVCALLFSFLGVYAQVPDFPDYVRSKNDNAPCARYAVAMAGGIRTLTHRMKLFEANVVEANGNNVDVYAHLYFTDPANNFKGGCTRSRAGDVDNQLYRLDQ